MFDKFLCKHIQKKTICVGDVVPYVLLCVIPLMTCTAAGTVCYEMYGVSTIPMTTEMFIKCTAMGMFVGTGACTIGYLIKKLFKIEVAHCPINDDEERR